VAGTFNHVLLLAAVSGRRVCPAGRTRTAVPPDQFKYIVFSNPNWDWRTFNVAGTGSIDNATNFTCKMS
jgi:hypothetical protein